MVPPDPQLEFAWACGLFEGEGTIVANRRWASPVMRVTMADRDVLERFERAVGVGRINGPYGPYGKSRKVQYEWSLYTRDGIATLLARMRPWLSARRLAQAERVYIVVESARVKRTKAGASG
jgi:hypothetical protein